MLSFVTEEIDILSSELSTLYPGSDFNAPTPSNVKTPPNIVNNIVGVTQKNATAKNLFLGRLLTHPNYIACGLRFVGYVGAYYERSIL